MAIARKQPECPYCGEKIKAKPHTHQKGFVGDEFMGWDYRSHNVVCKYHPINKQTVLETVYGPPPDNPKEIQEQISNFFNQAHKQTNMQSTVIEMSVETTSQSSYNSGNPVQHKIECNVPYGQDNVFYRMSGGTTLTLMTINDEAAKLFSAGDTIIVTIERKPKKPE